MTLDMGKLSKNRWLLVVLVIGIVCLLFGSSISSLFQHVTPAVATVAADGTGGNNPGGEGNAYTPVTNPSLAASQSIDTYYDEQLTNILLKIAGINAVTVMVTVNGSQTETLAQNTQTTTTTEKSATGGISNSTSVSNNVVSESGSSGGSAPIVVSTSEPSVQGVLVTVAANDFAVARSEIIDAIQNVLDMPAYKISVEPQKVN